MRIRIISFLLIILSIFSFINSNKINKNYQDQDDSKKQNIVMAQGVVNQVVVAVAGGVQAEIGSNKEQEQRRSTPPLQAGRNRVEAKSTLRRERAPVCDQEKRIQIQNQTENQTENETKIQKEIDIE